MSTQLTLPFNLHHDATFDNFYPGNNKFLISQLANMPQAREATYAYLWGAGVGCTHLLQACCRVTLDRDETAMYVSLAEVLTLSPKLFENLELYSLICLDDVQAIAGKADWEEAVFHLYNRCQNSKCCLLIAGKTVPKELGIQLPDLVSRLEDGLIFPVQPLNDVEKCAALQFRAQLLAMELSPEIGQFLLRHLARDWPTLFAALEKLDHTSLVAQRKLTIPFVKQVLGI